MQDLTVIDQYMVDGDYQKAWQAIEEAKAELTENNISGLDLRIREAQTLLALEKGNECLACLNEVLTTDPNHIEALNLLGQLYQAAGMLQKGIEAYEKMLSLAPTDARPLEGLASILFAAGKVEDALRCLKRSMEIQPDDLTRTLKLARGFWMAGYPRHAESLLLPLVDVYPDKDEVIFLLGDCCFHLERPAEALRYYKSVGEGEKYAKAQMRQVNVLLRQEKLDEAIEQADHALLIEGTNQAELYTLKGTALFFKGNKAEALFQVDAALESDFRWADAWSLKSNIDPDSYSQNQITQLESLCDKATSYNVRLLFALSEVYEKNKQYKQQIELLNRANALVASSKPYDPDVIERFDAKVLGWYGTHKDLEVVVNTKEQPFKPVFILGLPRSGTSLLEHILSANPKIDTTGETLALSHALDGQEFEALLDMPEKHWVPQFAQRYLDYQSETVGQAYYVTDKNIANYRIVGLLQRAFPSARFIAIHRHPLDVCLGGWKRIFNKGQNWVYTEAGLAHSVRCFEKMISSWQLKGGVNLLEIDYEALVQSPEVVVPSICDFLDLEFEQRMLTAHTAKRAVITASAGQIREKINDSAVWRWQQYAPYLSGFVHHLKQLKVDVPGYDEYVAVK